MNDNTDNAVELVISDDEASRNHRRVVSDLLRAEERAEQLAGIAAELYRQREQADRSTDELADQRDELERKLQLAHRALEAERESVAGFEQRSDQLVRDALSNDHALGVALAAADRYADRIELLERELDLRRKGWQESEPCNAVRDALENAGCSNVAGRESELITKLALEIRKLERDLAGVRFECDRRAEDAGRIGAALDESMQRERDALRTIDRCRAIVDPKGEQSIVQFELPELLRLMIERRSAAVELRERRIALAGNVLAGALDAGLKPAERIKRAAEVLEGSRTYT